MSLNAQGQSLMFKKLFDRGILSGHPNVDNTIVTLVVTQVDGKFCMCIHSATVMDVVSMFTSQYIPRFFSIHSVQGNLANPGGLCKVLGHNCDSCYNCFSVVLQKKKKTLVLASASVLP